jgi:hypothetical protein
MTKFNKGVFWILGVIFLITPIIFYTINFWGINLSNDTKHWAEFGDYLNGTFMPLIALAGVAVTLLLGIISEMRNSTNIKIEQQKHRPLLHIGYFDAENYLRIFLKNKGNGPLIITNYRLKLIKSDQEQPSIFTCLPKIEGTYNNYTGNQNNVVVAPDEKIELFLFKQSKESNSDTFERDKLVIRSSLSQYKFIIDYKDVYENPMPTYERSLEWFGRNLNS